MAATENYIISTQQDLYGSALDRLLLLARSAAADDWPVAALARQVQSEIDRTTQKILAVGSARSDAEIDDLIRS